MQILQRIVEQNNELSVDQNIRSNKKMLDRALEKAVHLAGHDYLVCVISDFFGLSDRSLHHVKQLCRHNDVMLSLIYDPLARKLPENGSLVISDGTRQVLLDSKESRLKKRFPEFLEGRLKTLTENLDKFGVPVLPVNTTESVALQVRRILGYKPGKSSRAGKVAVRGSR